MARPNTTFHSRLRCLQDGALGGLAGGVLLAVLLALTRGLSSLADAVGPPSPLLGLLLVVGLGAVTGVLFAMIARGRLTSNAAYTAAGLVWGLVVWAALVLVVLPRLGGAELAHPWTVETFRDAVPTLLGHVLLGATTGRVYDWLQCRGCSE